MCVQPAGREGTEWESCGGRDGPGVFPLATEQGYDLGGEKGISVPRGVGMGDLSEHVADSASQRAGQLSRGDLEPGLVCLRKLGMASVAAASWAGGKWWEEASPV